MSSQGGRGQKLPILLSKKTTKRGGGGQKSPILRRHSLWTAPYCTTYSFVYSFLPVFGWLYYQLFVFDIWESQRLQFSATISSWKFKEQNSYQETFEMKECTFTYRTLCIMAIWVVEFPREGYKIRYIFLLNCLISLISQISYMTLNFANSILLL